PARHPLGKMIFLIAVFFVFFVFTPFISMAAANGADYALTGLNTAADEGYGAGTSAGTAGIMTSLPGAIGKVIGVILSLVGVVFLILMIYGGFIWMLARGNDQEVVKAKNLIQSAIIGLIIVLAAYAITAYIGDKLT
ncbi:hypothetical protein KAJ61_03085, partial [Candidatus Parcubacteria bacterium]|nr:hypothetical protein [Candidatus Parcubacteria bacterium]